MDSFTELIHIRKVFISAHFAKISTKKFTFFLHQKCNFESFQRWIPVSSTNFEICNEGLDETTIWNLQWGSGWDLNSCNYCWTCGKRNVLCKCYDACIHRIQPLLRYTFPNKIRSMVRKERGDLRRRRNLHIHSAYDSWTLFR